MDEAVCFGRIDGILLSLGPYSCLLRFSPRKPGSLEKTKLPENLRSALWADPLADENFRGWPNSQKLQAVVWVTQSRKPETRAARITGIVGCARDGVHLSTK